LYGREALVESRRSQRNRDASANQPIGHWLLAICHLVSRKPQLDVRNWWHNLRMASLDALPISERFVRASGPGGQNVNKVATAVELRLDVVSAPLPDYVKARLVTLAGNRMTTDGILMIDSREYRTQAQNREAARARLAALLEQAAVRPKVRRKTKPSKAAKARRITDKVQRSEIKRGRSKIPADE